MQMTSMYWLILGIVFLFIELASPGFIVMFFGMAAITVSLIVFLFPSLGQIVPWLLFAIFSVVYIVLFRKLLKRIFLGEKNAPDRLEDTFIGKYAVVTDAIAPGKPGKVEFSGCLWGAEAGETIEAGERVKIVSKDSLTLTVSKS